MPALASPSDNLPQINHFDVFENTFDRYTYRNFHTEITAENVNEDLVPWIAVVFDEDVRDLQNASEFVTFSWFLCDAPQSQTNTSHVSFQDLAGSNCTDGGYSTQFSYADQSEVGLYSTLGVHAKNSSGDTFTLQSRATLNSNTIIFGAQVRNSGSLSPGEHLQTFVEDVLRTSYNPATVDTILERLSSFNTRTGNAISQSWYRCPDALPVLFAISGTNYPVTNQVPVTCTNLNVDVDTYEITGSDVSKYLVSAISIDNVTQVVSTYIPVPTPTQYDVLFESNGGSAVANSSFPANGEIISAPSSPTKSGYVFDGWALTSDGPAITFPYAPGVTRNVTLYARWKALSKATALTMPTTSGSLTSTKTAKNNRIAAPGTWVGTPTPTFAYQWFLCTKAISSAKSKVPSGCYAISGKTTLTLPIKSSYKGKYLAIRVTATSSGTSATTWVSKATSKVK